jgi:hypothetical protein
MTDTNSSNSGLGFCSLLSIVFITLKLTGYIDWGWQWVLAPLWMPIVAVIIIFAAWWLWENF